ncbi:MAG: hypothetical protein WA874_08565 [Chryseosolibacter sp.]
MKLLFHIMIFSSMLALSACNVHAQKSPQRTSSARAAYGNAVSDFKANKKKNQKRKKKARKEGKRKEKTTNNRSYWHGRPY